MGKSQDERVKRQTANSVAQELIDDTDSVVASRGFVEVALSLRGCRIVQRVMDLAEKETLVQFVDAMAPRTLELLASPNGNHVLAKVIERLPGEALQPLIEQLRNKGFTIVARHRFGCRVLQRLIEHCTVQEVVTELVGAVVQESYLLCRHPYGNFVVQHILEHGTAPQRQLIIANMLTTANRLSTAAPVGIPMLSKHRTASHVVQKALDFADAQYQRIIVESLLCAPAHGEYSIEEVCRSRYGSFVVEQIATRRTPLFEVVQQRLHGNLLVIAQTDYGRRVAEAFELEVPESMIPVTPAIADEQADEEDDEDAP